MLTASVVVRAFNEEKHIGRLLAGLMSQTRCDLDIIVVDSGSTDATIAIARHFPVRILSIEPKNFSFGRSLNLGCQAARGDIVVVASAHVYPVYTDWIERLMMPFESKSVALSYGKQRGSERTHPSEYRIFEQWFPADGKGTQRSPFCNNANAAIRRDIWRDYPYDETLTGLEDIDWARRVMSAGYQIHYCPDAEIVHIHDQDLYGIYNRYRREAMALAKIFPAESFSRWDFVRLLFGNIRGDAADARAERRLLAGLPRIVSFRAMQFLGTYRGFRLRDWAAAEVRSTLYYPQKARPGRDRKRTPLSQREVLHYDRLKIPEPTPSSSDDAAVAPEGNTLRILRDGAAPSLERSVKNAGE